ncbi:Cys-tRNA(Pro) deacylase [Planococcus lenghuensis]|uniref:Cys-tRNA(Pro)/Cys-tRNA(Cys) deacylase n=1 Tax=Planococcus lenghuensis TaxID=2213202 RepID=A0A1Q2L1Q8_9BACL|nr:Cys-tRNA(Pro) deacylase [Planococcus lenghuensis]AQQ54353.1 aminoacyl-tRNA deacylase [Planococcus lenghuensis]
MAKKPAKTNAARLLDRENIDYEVLQYETEDGKIDGVSVAAKIGAAPAEVYKTLVAQGQDKQPYVFIIPVADELDLKRAAKASGEKKIEMLPAKDITAVTGYVRGGCSPLGMKKQFPTYVASQAQELESIIVSAGKIGMQLKLAPAALLEAAAAEYAELTETD